MNPSGKNKMGGGDARRGACFIFSSSSSSFYAFIFYFKVFGTRTQYIHLFIDNNARKLGRELYKMMIGSQ
jgi:hypothetical protein